MRRRLLFSTLAVAVAAVLLLGVPLAFVFSRLQVSEASQQVRRDAVTLARGLQARVNAGLPPNAADAFILADGDTIESVRHAHAEACQASRQATADLGLDE